MSKLFLLFFLTLLFGCNSEKVTTGIPAEWENQEAVFLTYTADPEDLLTTKSVHDDCDEFIKYIFPRIKIFVLIDSTDNQDSLRRIFESRKYNTANIQLVPIADLFSMGVARDYGPIIIKKEDGTRQLLQFDWNYIGANLLNPDTSWENWKNKRRDAYFKQMRNLLNMDIVKSSLLIEGGEIELNGKGTAMLVEAFTKPRNHKLNSTELDSLLKKTLNLKNIIWLKEGVAEDPSAIQSYVIHENIYGFGVGGHIDEFSRFANANTILLAQPDKSEAISDPVKKINFDRMKINFEILKNAKDQNGNNFTIVKVPIPDVLPNTFVIDTSKRQELQVSVIKKKNPHLKHGDSINFIPAVSYLNYVVLNEVVIIPKYWKVGLTENIRKKDEQVKTIFTQLFPDKEVIQLSPLGLNYAGGGFHCWTQQIPY